jgi:hypothetical protein
MKVKAERYFEMSADFYQVAERHVQEDNNLIHRRIPQFLQANSGTKPSKRQLLRISKCLETHHLRTPSSSICLSIAHQCRTDDKLPKD